MLSTFLDKLSGYLDKRFLLNVWFPSFIFGAVWVVLYALVIGPTAAIEQWAALPFVTQLWLGVGALIVVTVFAYVCDNLLGAIVRLFEGYWPEWAEPLRRAMIDSQQRQWQYLQVKRKRVTAQFLNMKSALERLAEQPPEQKTIPTLKDLDKHWQAVDAKLKELPGHRNDQQPQMLVALFSDVQDLRAGIVAFVKNNSIQKDAWLAKKVQLEQSYEAHCGATKDWLQSESNRLASRRQALPRDPSLLMPTRLGNALRAAEEYSLRAYNFDAVVVWPRLALVLPETFRASLEQAGTPMLTMLFASALAALFAFTSGATLAVVGAPLLLMLACWAGGIILSVWFYNSAVYRALGYGALLDTAFDLYRRDLIKALGISMPASPLAEWLLWPDLTQWWYDAIPPLRDATDPVKPKWYFEGHQPKADDSSIDQHAIYLTFGTPPKGKS